MVRSVLGIIAGYAVFLISSALLFHLTNRTPRDPAEIAFALFTVAYGSCFGLLAGQIAARIAARRQILHASIVAALVVLGALIAIFVDPRSGSPLTPICAILVVAPCVVIGGYVRSRTVLLDSGH